MKIAVAFPSVAYREGPAKVLELASAIEEIGYDEINEATSNGTHQRHPLLRR